MAMSVIIVRAGFNRDTIKLPFYMSQLTTCDSEGGNDKQCRKNDFLHSDFTSECGRATLSARVFNHVIAV